jgi:hypothetical protein
LRSRAPALGTKLKAELVGDPLQGVGEGIADGVTALGELVLQLGITDAERPELIEEKRPVGIALEEHSELLGRFLTRLPPALGGIGSAVIRWSLFSAASSMSICTHSTCPVNSLSFDP